MSPRKGLRKQHRTTPVGDHSCLPVLYHSVLLMVVMSLKPLGSSFFERCCIPVLGFKGGQSKE